MQLDITNHGGGLVGMQHFALFGLIRALWLRPSAIAQRFLILGSDGGRQSDWGKAFGNNKLVFPIGSERPNALPLQIIVIAFP